MDELTEEKRQLTWERDYYRSLVDNFVMQIMPTLHFHSAGLHSAIRKCSEDVEQAAAQHG